MNNDLHLNNRVQNEREKKTFYQKPFKPAVTERTKYLQTTEWCELYVVVCSMVWNIMCEFLNIATCGIAMMQWIFVVTFIIIAICTCMFPWEQSKWLLNSSEAKKKNIHICLWVVRKQRIRKFSIKTTKKNSRVHFNCVGFLCAFAFLWGCKLQPVTLYSAHMWVAYVLNYGSLRFRFARKMNIFPHGTHGLLC